jgi:conjugative transfer region protein TrbK
MDEKMLARLGAIVFGAVAVTATAIELTRKEDAPAGWSARRVEILQADPLRTDLIRCQRLGEAGPRDAACLRAWAENRERFLAPGARPMERLPDAATAPRPRPDPAPQQGEAR